MTSTEKTNTNVIAFPKASTIRPMGSKETKTVLPTTRCFLDYGIHRSKKARSRTLDQLRKEGFTRETTVGIIAQNIHNRWCWMRTMGKDSKGQDQENWVAVYVLEEA